MKLPRRQFLRLVTTAVAVPVVSRFAWAQTYPTRPVRIIVGFAPGGSQDIVARLIGQWLSNRLRQQFVVENRTGAGGNIAADAVVRSRADGYTLLLAGLSNAVNAALYDKLSFNFVQDTVAVANVIRVPGVMEVNPTFPANNVPELIAAAKANPGKISMATSGTGSPSHMYAELLKMLAGIDLVLVPYRGSAPALTDLLGGQVQMTIDPIASSIEYIKAGRLRALAVTTAKRSDVLPDVPSLNDFLHGFDPADFSGFIRDETEKWGKVVKFAGLKPE